MARQPPPEVAQASGGGVAAGAAIAEGGAPVVGGAATRYKPTSAHPSAKEARIAFDLMISCSLL
jgi:hypothetical protein